MPTATINIILSTSKALFILSKPIKENEGKRIKGKRMLKRLTIKVAALQFIISLKTNF